ncbi:MAG: DUF4041 domain-containing protein [Bacteroidetes bacterium]|nr:DUF4041 domain-containing protein [Bacteroidota bacterium]
MISSNIIVIASGGVIVAIGFTWLIASKYFNKKISDYNSLNLALNESEESLLITKKEINEKKIQTEKLHKKLSQIEIQIDDRKKKFGVIQKRTKKLVDLEKRAAEIKDLLDNGKNKHDAISAKIKELEIQKEKVISDIQDLQGDIDLYSRLNNYIDFGIFEEPEYIHETSERYKIEIKTVRDKQKKLIQDKIAIETPEDVEVTGTSKNGKTILAGQAKIMLRAFNIESDLLIGKVSPSNFARTLERIDKVAESLEKASITLLCGISIEYMKLKYEECKLFYEYKLKKQEEKEEQRIIREQIREEKAIAAEYKKAQEKAEKEELMYEKLINKATKALAKAQDNEKILLESKIEVLKEQLKEAQAKGLRAKSMAQLTKRGHVYVISNLGSFGEGIYKIGLTRRLDPMDSDLSCFL